MEVILDASQMEKRKMAHTYLAEQLEFPEYYGHNLDALYDCLSDMTDLKVKFINIPSEPKVEADGTIKKNYFDKVLRVFKDVAEDYENLEIIDSF